MNRDKSLKCTVFMMKLFINMEILMYGFIALTFLAYFLIFRLSSDICDNR